MTIKVGDAVRVRGGEAVGVIKQIDNGSALIQSAWSEFPQRAALSLLEVVQPAPRPFIAQDPETGHYSMPDFVRDGLLAKFPVEVSGRSLLRTHPNPFREPDRPVSRNEHEPKIVFAGTESLHTLKGVMQIALTQLVPGRPMGVLYDGGETEHFYKVIRRTLAAIDELTGLTEPEDASQPTRYDNGD